MSIIARLHSTIIKTPTSPQDLYRGNFLSKSVKLHKASDEVIKSLPRSTDLDANQWQAKSVLPSADRIAYSNAKHGKDRALTEQQETYNNDVRGLRHLEGSIASVRAQRDGARAKYLKNPSKHHDMAGIAEAHDDSLKSLNAQHLTKANAFKISQHDYALALGAREKNSVLKRALLFGTWKKTESARSVGTGIRREFNGGRRPETVS